MARDILTEYLPNIHENISVRDSGLFCSEVYPYLGTSPDGILGCCFCETIFVVEINCPIKATKMGLTEFAISDESFCMEYVNGEYILRKDNAYYYQVQLQIFLIQAKACYFFVYSREVSLCQIILFDEIFLAKKVPV